MKTRIISGLILLPIVLLTIYMGGDILKFTLLFTSLIGLFEFYRATNGKNEAINYINSLVTIVYYVFFLNSNLPKEMLFLSYFMVLFCYEVLNYPKVNITNVANSIFGVIYIPILFSLIYLVREFEQGIYFIWLVLITSFATDTFAYFTGVFFGKHKLIPHLSPNKTIEGSIGGIVGTIVTCIAYTLLFNYIFTTTHNVAYSAIIGFACSIFAQFGDLTASSIKRLTGVKDFGNLIPGHGGILDRFDSILFTAPIVYIIILIG